VVEPEVVEPEVVEPEAVDPGRRERKVAPRRKPSSKSKAQDAAE